MRFWVPGLGDSIELQYVDIWIYIYICTHKYVHMYMYPTNPHNITIRSSVQVSYCMIIYIYNYMYISIDLYIHIYYIIVYLYILLYIYMYHMSRRYGSRSCTIIHRLVIGRVKLTKLSEMKGVPLSLHLNQRNVLRLENIPLIYIYIIILVISLLPLNHH